MPLRALRRTGIEGLAEVAAAALRRFERYARGIATDTRAGNRALRATTRGYSYGRTANFTVSRPLSGIRIVDSGPTFVALLRPLVEAIRRHLVIQMENMIRDGERYWQSNVPYVSGTLRASCVGAITHADSRSITAGFRVVFPGSDYYDTVAALPKYRKLRNLRIVLDWVDKNAIVYVNRAVDDALRETE